MDRNSKKLSILILASCLSTPVLAQNFIQHKLGSWTQVQGHSSFMLYKAGVRKPVDITVGNQILTEGSYLSNEEGQMTGKLFENCWVRLGPQTKIVFNFSPEEKILYLRVFTGSVKILFNKEWSKSKVDKLIVEAGDKQLETESGKFVFIRRPFFNENNLYVEKGLVSLVHENRMHSQLIHRDEKLSFNDKTKISTEVVKMTDKEVKEITSSEYLRRLKQQTL